MRPSINTGACRDPRARVTRAAFAGFCGTPSARARMRRVDEAAIARRIRAPPGRRHAMTPEILAGPLDHAPTTPGWDGEAAAPGAGRREVSKGRGCVKAAVGRGAGGGTRGCGRAAELLEGSLE